MLKRPIQVDKIISLALVEWSILLLLSVMVLFCSASFAEGTGASGNGQSGTSGSSKSTSKGPQDTNSVTPEGIRKNYSKRYPFAKEQANTDVIENGESQSGSKETYDNAYCQVKWYCNDDSENPHRSTFDEHYHQNQEQGSVTLATVRDKEALKKGLIHTYGLPCSDTQYQLIDRECRQRFLELFFDPERWMWKETMLGHMQSTSISNSIGGAAEASFEAAFDRINDNLINVANDSSALVASGSNNGGGNGRKSLKEAVYIVQQMYKHIFVPMAVLFLLPGALFTQVKGLVGRAFLGDGVDASSPFEGIVRAMIAVFLIPATQLVVSYSVDVGNALANAVRDPSHQWIEKRTVLDWAKEQTFNPPQANAKNGIFPGDGKSNSQGGNQSHMQSQAAGSISGSDSATSSGAIQGLLGSSGDTSGSQAGTVGSSFTSLVSKVFGVSVNEPTMKAANDFLNWVFGGVAQKMVSEPQEVGEGKTKGELEGKVTPESQVWLSGAIQMGFNSSACVLGYSLTVLTAYQLVFICYLFLLGPIAAAFYCWPSGVGTLFRKVFSNWLDAVVVLSLWRFWWCVILAVMTQRIIYLHPNPGSMTEMMVFNCFLALLLYVPFQPFSFNPGPIVSSVLDKAAGGGGAQSGAVSPQGQGLPAAGHSQPGHGATGHSHSVESTTSSTLHDGHTVTAGGSGGDESEEASPKGQSAPGKGQALGSTVPPSRIRRVGEIPSAAALVGPPGTAGDAIRASGLEPPTNNQSASMENDNEATRVLRQEMGITNVESISNGTAPTVALGAQGGERVLVNTGNAQHAKAAMTSWQRVMPITNASTASAMGEQPRHANYSAGLTASNPLQDAHQTTPPSSPQTSSAGASQSSAPESKALPKSNASFDPPPASSQTGPNDPTNSS